MDILHLARTMGQGGAEKIIYQLATGCNTFENKIVIASCGGVYEQMLEKEGIHHYQIHDLECKKPHVILQTLASLMRIIKEEDIQIIHSHHRMAAFYARILKLFKPKLKLVYTAHNVFYDKAKLTSLALKHTNIVAVGESVKKNLTEEFMVDEDRIKTIFNAVDIQDTDWEHPKLKTLKEEGCMLLGLIGRLSEQKGVDVFIQAMELLVKKYPYVKGIIVGDGELKNQMQALVRKKHLEEHVYFLGYQAHITAIIKQLDLVAMPSRWEGFPLTPIEVFAMGRTLVASDIGGINEIVEDGRNGLLVEKDDPKLLSEGLEVLLLNEEMRRNLEQQARIDYEERYSYDSFLEQYMHLYKKMLGKVFIQQFD